MLTFAIGCILGRSVQLADLLKQCSDYAGHHSARYVLLGNFINVGPDSREVVEAIIDLLENTANRVMRLPVKTKTSSATGRLATTCPGGSFAAAAPRCAPTASRPQLTYPHTT